MRIVCFNANSIRTRLHQIEEIRRSHDPEVIAIQETKCRDADFPMAEINALGYRAEIFGQPGHYGVALLSKSPLTDVEFGFPGDEADAQRRLIRAQIGDINIINGYFPQGDSREHPVKFPAKQRFYHDLVELLEKNYNAQTTTLLMGDFNIAFQDQDIGLSDSGHKRWLKTGKASFLPEERDWYQQVLEQGYFDSYRHLYPEDNSQYSWFDYRSRGFEATPKRGLRIDHILVTKNLLSRVSGAGIDYAIRAMDKPSDHCPIWLQLD